MEAGMILWSSVILISVNLLQDHNKSRDEDVVDIWKYGKAEIVSSQHDACGSMLTVHLQNQIQMHARYTYCQILYFR